MFIFVTKLFMGRNHIDSQKYREEESRRTLYLVWVVLWNLMPIIKSKSIFEFLGKAPLISGINKHLKNQIRKSEVHFLRHYRCIRNPSHNHLHSIRFGFSYQIDNTFCKQHHLHIWHDCLSILDQRRHILDYHCSHLNWKRTLIKQIKHLIFQN